MRTHGTLTKWNDERGFGFISPAQGSDDVFVHISAFPRDGVRPMLNELVSYETESGKDGKQRAVGIIRPGQKHRPRHSRESNHDSRPSGAFGVALVVLVVIAAGAYHYSRVRMTAAVHDETPAYLEAPDTPQDMSSFDCDGGSGAHR